MKNKAQSLYERLVRQPEKLTWFEMFQGIGHRYSKTEADYAMIAGTTLDSVKDETGMLQKWQRPWLYKHVLLAGIASCVLLFAANLGIIEMGYFCPPAFFLLYYIVPPCVIPVTLMIFFWEMNAPRNISLVEIIRYFFTGGVLSIFATFILNELKGDTSAWLAPLTEEPAKLLISLFFLAKLKKKTGKLYGLNGLAIGAAVGAGFAAFESSQYAYQQYCYALAENLQTNTEQTLVVILTGNAYFDLKSFLYVTQNIGLRALCALGSHVLYCAPYAAIAAFYMGDGINIVEVLRKIDFVILFIISLFSHMFWNSPLNINFWIKLIIVILVLWKSAQYAMQKSFAQLAAKVPISGNNTQTTSLRIQGVSGIHAGVVFRITKNEILIGSDQSCQLNYPINTYGISPQHCKLLVRNGGVYLADLGTPNGTWLNGIKCTPAKGFLLHSGDTFYLGTPDQSFTIL